MLVYFVQFLFHKMEIAKIICRLWLDGNDDNLLFSRLLPTLVFCFRSSMNKETTPLNQL